jgi:hypothetical protein
MSQTTDTDNWSTPVSGAEADGYATMLEFEHDSQIARDYQDYLSENADADPASVYSELSSKLSMLAAAGRYEPQSDRQIVADVPNAQPGVLAKFASNGGLLRMAEFALGGALMFAGIAYLAGHEPKIASALAKVTGAKF